ncbi:dienelactone hydrolase family protein [Paracraurococcus ruber]|uniref:Dienelactone hydrolase n=1 Tax=Paracraurococcus ruber TaxID=77675 RepID=A0ABS1D2W4_9PROT|nr:hypothetical protein [Paracraurococcus ruber]MBK1661018.1 hypothetical protein [Paracraurococcus ruber]TDG29328.1 hypothetical protein E2C05_18190 [Paracraurococcus ruber]
MTGRTLVRMQPWRRLAALALMLPALLAGPAGAATPHPAVEDTELLALGDGEVGLLTLPQAPRPGRPAPVVLLLPDQDGAGPRSAVYGQRVLENGYAVLEAHFGAGAEDAEPPPPPMRLAILLAAVAADPRLDAARIAVIGLGEGARAALLGLGSLRPGEATVAGLALLYPGCDQALARAAGAVAANTTQRPQVLLLHGDEDAVNDTAACTAVAAGLPAQDRVRHRVLTGASYGWDAYGMVRPGGVALLPDPTQPGRRAWVQPDPGVTMVAADRVLGLVVTALGQP